MSYDKLIYLLLGYAGKSFIDDSYKDNDIPAEVVMIPHKIRDVMK